MIEEFFTLRRKGAKETNRSKHQRFFGHAVGDSLDTMLDHVLAKIDKEPKSFIHQPEISHDLFAVHRIERSNRFHLHDYEVIDDQVGTEPFIESDPIPGNWNGYLSFYGISLLTQLMRKQDFVYDFEDARPEASVQAVGSINNHSRDFILFHKSELALLLPPCEAKNLQPFSFSRLSGFAPLRESSAIQGREKHFTLRRQDAKRKEGKEQ